MPPRRGLQQILTESEPQYPLPLSKFGMVCFRPHQMTLYVPKKDDGGRTPTSDPSLTRVLQFPCAFFLHYAQFVCQQAIFVLHLVTCLRQ